MNEQQVLGTFETTSGSAASRAWKRVSIGLYVQYYALMFLLYFLGKYESWADSLGDAVVFRRVLYISTFIAIIYCVYRLIFNRKMADDCMKMTPNWMYDLMDRFPGWVNRWLMNHTAMRVFMIGMDLMVAWMCEEYIRLSWGSWGW